MQGTTLTCFNFLSKKIDQRSLARAPSPLYRNYKAIGWRLLHNGLRKLLRNMTESEPIFSLECFRTISAEFRTLPLTSFWGLHGKARVAGRR